MGSRTGKSALAWLALATAGLGAGCGSKASETKSNPLNFDADFSVCATSPQAVRYAPGISVVSSSGTYQAAITSASTDQGSGTPVPTAAIGYDTFTVAVTMLGDGGAGNGAGSGIGSDAGVVPPDGLVMAPPPTSPTYPADPYMPVHGHGASTVPAVTALGDGAFSVASIDFFMAGYWELYLELTPPGGTPDPLTFKICIPDD